MKTFYSPVRAVLIGKASDVFSELAIAAKWEKYGIGYKYFSLTVLTLN